MGNIFDVIDQIQEKLKNDKKCTLNLEALKQRVPDADIRNTLIRFLKKQGMY